MREGSAGVFVRYALAVVVTAAAVAARWLLDPWLGDRLALVTLYGAVAVAVWFGGLGPNSSAPHLLRLRVAAPRVRQDDQRPRLPLLGAIREAWAHA